jgi:PEP-CTERM motif
MRMMWIGVGLFLSGVALFATPACTGDSISDYGDLGTTGCSVGPLIFDSFNFDSDSGSIDANDVFVGPSTSGNDGYGLVFSSEDFFAAPDQTYHYYINYQIDPPPPILRFDSDLTNPQVGSGTLEDATIQLDTYLCPGATVVSTTMCSDSSTPFDLVTDLANPQNSYVFPNPNSTVGVMNVLTITGNDTGGGVDGLSQYGDVPEPATLLFVAFGIAGIVLARRRFSVRNARRSS